MSLAITLDPARTSTGCRVPTIAPAIEFEPGKSYELPDDQAQALLALPDGPFMRVALKVAREQAAAEQPGAPIEQQPATEATSTEEAL
jgi:hypothetical protein